MLVTYVYAAEDVVDKPEQKGKSAEGEGIKSFSYWTVVRLGTIAAARAARAPAISPGPSATSS